MTIFGLLLATWLRQRRAKKLPAFPAEVMIARSLGFNVIAFLMLPLGIWVATLAGHEKSLLTFPVLQSIFVAAAEVGVNAIAYSLAGELVPTRLQGLFTGYLFLNIAFGTNLAGPFSNVILGQYQHLTTVAASQTNPAYLRMFLLLAAIALGITLVYWAIQRPIARLRKP